MTPRAKLIAFQTILTKEVLRFARIWIQTVLPPVVTTALYFIIFGNLIGPRIGPMEGFDYMEFIIPGLIMMAVITNSYANVVSSFYGSKFQRHIEEMLISPIPNYIILTGFVGGGVARGLTVGIAVTIVSLVFHPLNIHSPWVMFSMIMLTSILFSLAGLINGVYAKSFDDISIVPGRDLLLHQPATGVLATGIADQPDPVHGERVPLRLPGCQRYQPGVVLHHQHRLYRHSVRIQPLPAAQGPRHKDLEYAAGKSALPPGGAFRVLTAVPVREPGTVTCTYWPGASLLRTSSNRLITLIFFCSGNPDSFITRRHCERSEEFARPGASLLEIATSASIS